MVDISTVSIVIASAGVFAAAIYYIIQIRHQTKVRQTDLLLRMYSTFGSEEFQKALTKIVNMEFKEYNDFVKKYSSPTGFSEKPESIALGTVNVFFEEIGVLLHRKLIDPNLVDDLFGYIAIFVWEKVKPIAEGWRRQFQAPRSLQQFEYLYNEMKKREQQPTKIG